MGTREAGPGEEMERRGTRGLDPGSGSGIVPGCRTPGST